MFFSYWHLLGINNIIEFLQEVRVQLIVIICERMEVHQDIFLHCNMIHDMDEIQKSLRQKETKFIFAKNSFTVAFHLNILPSFHLKIRNHKAGWHHISATKARPTFQVFNLTAIVQKSSVYLTSQMEIHSCCFPEKLHLTYYISLFTSWQLQKQGNSPSSSGEKGVHTSPVFF